MLFSDKLSKSFCIAPENTMQLHFFMCPVIIWDPWLFYSCVKLVIGIIKMPFGLSLRTSQYCHSYGVRIAISTWERRRIIYLVGICDVHYLCQKTLQQSSTRAWDEGEQRLCWERGHSLYHHECDHSFWWMCLDLKKYTSLRALEDGGKCSFPVVVSYGEQEHKHSWYLTTYM